MGEKKKEEKTKGSASMVAPHPHAAVKKKQEEAKLPFLLPVEQVAKGAGIQPWETAGLMQAAGWMPGKQVTEEEFGAKLKSFRQRPQGGGRI